MCIQGYTDKCFPRSTFINIAKEAIAKLQTKNHRVHKSKFENC